MPLGRGTFAPAYASGAGTATAAQAGNNGRIDVELGWRPSRV